MKTQFPESELNYGFAMGGEISAQRACEAPFWCETILITFYWQAPGVHFQITQITN